MPRSPDAAATPADLASHPAPEPEPTPRRSTDHGNDRTHHDLAGRTATAALRDLLPPVAPPPHPDRAGRRRPGHLLAAVPGPAAAVAGVGAVRRRALPGDGRRGDRRRVHLGRAGGRGRRREAAAGRLRPDRAVPDDLPDLVDGAADRAAGEHARAGHRPAADREDGPRDLRHRVPGWPTAGSARCPRSATCSGGPASRSGRSPAGCGRSRPGGGSGSGSGPRTSAPRCGTPGTA